jgi:hypothetical protein
MAAGPQNESICKGRSELVIAKSGGKEFVQNGSFLRISGEI